MKKRILIVDDEIDILEPLSLLLEIEGYNVDSTLRGDEIYKKINDFNPDIILLDVLISGSDGREICKLLKRKNTTKNIPIILISAHPSAYKDVQTCNANGFIAKPFEISEVIKTIEIQLLKR